MERQVRGKDGLIPWREGVTAHAIRDWLEKQSAAGKPSSYEDFYAAHGLCLNCLGHGAQMIGWSEPVTPVDIQAAEDFGLEQLPLYDVCPTCQSTGKL